MNLAAELMLYYSVGSVEYVQFATMLNRYTLANTQNMTMNPADQVMIGKPV
jgi:hypothetical protein